MRHRTALRPLGAALTLSLVAGALGAVAITTPAQAAASADDVSVDFSASTGAFRGGASGSLYGLGDAGAPSQAVLDGARVTNVSQKPPAGAQHPNGDALDVEKNFFAGAGQDLYVYVQDMYPDWTYHGGVRPGDDDGDGVWDYLPILKATVEKIATTSEHPEKYVFIPFNEPDGIWYQNWSTMKGQFLADWTVAYDLIQSVYAEHGLGHAKIAGPGESSWHADRETDFLTYAKAHDELPDVIVWHELGTQNLATFRSHMDAYRDVVKSVGIPELPVDITEYAMPRDMNVPGQLVQWLAMFEDEKVDAQTAYWNYAGNLSDNASRNNSANAGWWMLKWYGDLAGSTTVRLTPPVLNTVDSLQGIAAVDRSNRKATVLVGGGTKDVALHLTGLDAATFGASVDVVVRENRINGAEGDSLQPPVVLSTTARTSGGTVDVTVPNSDRYSAYQVVVTPHRAQRPAVATDLVDSTEAEAATLTDACKTYQNPSTEWSHLASGSYDVGCLNKPTSSVTWKVTVPRDGTYRLDLLAGANQAPGKQALFVDGSLDQVVSYAADLSWTYRGTTHATLHLKAGTHTLSVRPSKDGSTLLGGSDITLDRLDLYDVTDGEAADYPAVDARLSGDARLTYDGALAGAVRLAGDGAATTFVTAAETGYYDLTTTYATNRASTVTLDVNGRAVALPKTKGPGTWTSTARVYLPEGVSEVTARAPKGATALGLSTLRGSDQRRSDADTGLVKVYGPGGLALAGTAAVTPLPAGSNGVGGTDVEGLGKGGTATLARPAGFGPGEYQLVVAAANADKSDAINYNPQVISRFLDVAEAGGHTVRGTFRHNYAWQSFWNYTIPLDLTTRSGAVTLGNATAGGPNVNRVTLARFVAATSTTAAR
ncbi:CBM35 domain-containing protein [Luteimicrobium sp. DT211]|uniref:CBM35 domain-containing protein n=1 Tax=Luteimicrobium sp. DT211 TaxID=3393412 RepID=UPI003CF89565